MNNEVVIKVLGEMNMGWTIPRSIAAAVAFVLMSGVAGCSEQETKVEKPAEQQEGMGGVSGQEGMSGMSGQEGTSNSPGTQPQQ
ncbi:MAG: hypothetical protein ACK5KM_00280 [Hyphomicrobiaceae bacterium]